MITAVIMNAVVALTYSKRKRTPVNKQTLFCYYISKTRLKLSQSVTEITLGQRIKQTKQSSSWVLLMLHAFVNMHFALAQLY